MRLELLKAYNDETMVSALDDLVKELHMPPKIAFNNWWSLTHWYNVYEKRNIDSGHMTLPYEGISTIYISMENEKSVWYGIYDKRNKDSGQVDRVAQFPKESLPSFVLNVDKFLDMDENEYEKLCNYIDEPPLDDWKSWIMQYRKHLGVDI
jgi:hypothetical protein